MSTVNRPTVDHPTIIRHLLSCVCPSSTVNHPSSSIHRLSLLTDCRPSSIHCPLSIHCPSDCRPSVDHLTIICRPSSCVHLSLTVNHPSLSVHQLSPLTDCRPSTIRQLSTIHQLSTVRRPSTDCRLSIDCRPTVDRHCVSIHRLSTIRCRLSIIHPSLRHRPSSVRRLSLSVHRCVSVNCPTVDRLTVDHPTIDHRLSSCVRSSSTVNRRPTVVHCRVSIHHPSLSSIIIRLVCHCLSSSLSVIRQCAYHIISAVARNGEETQEKKKVMCHARSTPGDLRQRHALHMRHLHNRILI